MSHNWELIDSNALHGYRTYLGTGDDDDTVLVKREFDPHVTRAVLDKNKALQNEDFNRKDEMWHAAHVPAHVIFEWLTKHGVNFYNPDHMPAVKKLLNSSEYRWCKVKHIII